MSAPETIQVARGYAALGWSVFPILPRDKRPAVSSWSPYQTTAADEASISGWFSTGGYGVAIVQGAVSNTFVLDFDGELGHETLKKLEDRHGSLPVTPRAITPRGGVHIILLYPGRQVPSRVGVLPGMDVRGDGGYIVAHPSIHANGRRYEWDCDFHPDDVPVAEAPIWVLDLVCGESQPGSSPGAVIHVLRPNGPLGMNIDLVADGREQYMRDTVMAVMREQRDRLRRMPTLQELFDAAWPQYSRRVDFSRPGRGSDEVWCKCESTLNRALAGHIRGFSTEPADIEDAPKGDPNEPQPGDMNGPNDVFFTFGIDDLMSLPAVEWMIKDILTRFGFSILYGPPASLKTFLCLDLCLCVAAGLPWKGRETTQTGVLYVAAEGAPGIAKRVKAWRIKNNLNGVDLPFRLLPTSVNLTDPAQVNKLIRTAIAAAALEGCQIGLVVIDTLARSIPGADENSSRDMGLFVSAVETIKAGIACQVLSVHHSGKDAERGARGSSALLGAVDTMLNVKRQDRSLTLTIEKQKDDEEAAPINLVVEPVEWMSGLQPMKSLVLVDAPISATEQDFVSLHQQVAAAIGRGGKMASRRVAEALGFSNYKRDEMNQSIPFYPSYVEVTLPDGVCHLMRVRQTEAPNSPHLIVRTEVS